MMSPLVPFSVHLTPGELYYALGLNGFGRISLPGNPFAGWQSNAIQAKMLLGKKRLEERTFIRQTSSGEIAMDAAFAILLRTLALPAFFVEGQAHFKKNPPVHLNLYPEQPARQILEWTGLDYILWVYPPSAPDDCGIFTRFGITHQPEHEATLPPGSANLIVPLLKAAFTNHSALEHFYKKNAINSTEQLWIHHLMKEVDFLTILTLFVKERGHCKPTAMHIYVGNAVSVWQVSEDKTSGSIRFLPLSAQSVIDQRLF